MIRQLLPLKYSTHYFTGGPLISAEPETMGQPLGDDPTFVNVAYWRMWMGRVFAHERHRWQLADAGAAA